MFAVNCILFISFIWDISILRALSALVLIYFPLAFGLESNDFTNNAAMLIFSEVIFSYPDFFIVSALLSLNWKVFQDQ